jgi:hypothetical protein
MHFIKRIPTNNFSYLFLYFPFSEVTTNMEQDDDIVFEDFARLRLKGETEA